MTSRISHTMVDSRNAYQQSVWWAQVLGMREDPQDPNEPADEECMIFSADGRTRLLFIDVPEGKQAENRLHFDLRPTDATRDERSRGCLVSAPLRPPITAARTAADG
jgi:catechol 2,3-dioxygenase-like lactoylglutathione lyase family enzyme